MTDLTRDIAAECAAEKVYRTLLRDLMAVEAAQSRLLGSSVFLTDTEQDHEVALRYAVEGSVDYWEAAYGSAACQAGALAEDYGFDVNALLGYCIY